MWNRPPIYSSLEPGMNMYRGFNYDPCVSMPVRQPHSIPAPCTQNPQFAYDAQPEFLPYEQPPFESSYYQQQPSYRSTSPPKFIKFQPNQLDDEPSTESEYEDIPCSPGLAKKVKSEGTIQKIINKIPFIQPSDANECKSACEALKEESVMSCHDKSKSSKMKSTEDLNELWKLHTYKRWQTIEQWDQHKELFWKQLIQTRIDCPPRERGLELMLSDAWSAINNKEGECVAFKMLYNLLKRNEDLDLLSFVACLDDLLVIKLIVALNRLYIEDKDKRKSIFDEPPVTAIEKVMMKETLCIIDPSSKVATMPKRFWELLLDWYTNKCRV